MLCLGTVYSYSVFRKSIENYFLVGSTESGLPYMVALAFYAIFMWLTGKFIEKFKPSLIVFVGGIIVALSWIASSFATNILFLTLSYGVLGGAGAGIIYGVPMAVVAKWFPAKKGLAVGIVLMGFGLSPILTAPLAGFMVQNYGLQDTFMILGLVFGLIISILSMVFKFPQSTYNSLLSYNNHEDLSQQEMIREKSFFALYFNFILGSMIGLMIIGLTGIIGIDLVGIKAENISWYIAFFAIFNGVGRPFFGWVNDKFSVRTAMLLSYGLIVVAAVLGALAKTGDSLIYVLAFSLFWFNLGGWLAIAPAATMKLYGMKNYSANYGVVFTGYGIGAILGVATSGIIIDLYHNYQIIFQYILILALLGFILTLKNIKK